LYEYHAPTIEEACKLVKYFFEQTLDLNSFEKHFFNIGNQPHFITNDFIYRFNSGKIFALGLMVSVYLLFLFSVLFFTFLGRKNYMPLNAILPLILTIGIFIGYIATTTIKGRHQYLQISKGKTQFSYGYDEQHIFVYDKADVDEISYSVGGKGSIHNIKITFKNGEFIRPANLLDGMTLLNKFPDNLKVVTKRRFAPFGGG
jgi:hypothetical protein